MKLLVRLKPFLKRIYHIPGIVRFLGRGALLAAQGASISRVAAVSPLVIYGKLQNLSIGAGTFVGRAVLHLHQTVRIGENVVINDGVTIFTASHDVDSRTFEQTSGPVFIEDYVWVCTGAVILPGVRLGRGCVVGAFAVVTRDVAPYAVVVGSPARQVKERRCRHFEYRPVDFVAPFEAWRSR